MAATATTTTLTDGDLERIAAQPGHEVYKLNVATTLDEDTWPAEEIRAHVDMLKDATIEARTANPTMTDFVLRRDLLTDERWRRFCERHRFLFLRVTAADAQWRDMVILERIIEGIDRIQRGEVTKAENDTEVEEDMIALLRERNDDPDARDTAMSRRAQHLARARAKFLRKRYRDIKVPAAVLRERGAYVEIKPYILDTLEDARSRAPKKPFPATIPTGAVNIMRASTEARIRFCRHHGQSHEALEPTSMTFVPVMGRLAALQPRWTEEWETVA